MKRLALVATYLLILCACANYAGAQNWQPGMPGPGFAGPPGVGIPGLGGPPGAGMPGLGAPLGGPGCGASMCQPMPPCLKPPILFGSYAAWQVTSDPGKIKFSTQGTSLSLNDSSTAVQFNVNGVWVGGTARVPFSDCFSARVEGRVLIPSKESATSVTALCAAPPVARDWRACTKNIGGGSSTGPWRSIAPHVCRSWAGYVGILYMFSWQIRPSFPDSPLFPTNRI